MARDRQDGLPLASVAKQLLTPIPQNPEIGFKRCIVEIKIPRRVGGVSSSSIYSKVF